MGSWTDGLSIKPFTLFRALWQFAQSEPNLYHSIAKFETHPSAPVLMVYSILGSDAVLPGDKYQAEEIIDVRNTEVPHFNHLRFDADSVIWLRFRKPDNHTIGGESSRNVAAPDLGGRMEHRLHMGRG